MVRFRRCLKNYGKIQLSLLSRKSQKKKKRQIKPTETECEMCNKEMTKAEPFGQLEKALGKVTSELCFKEVKFH